MMADSYIHCVEGKLLDSNFDAQDNLLLCCNAGTWPKNREVS